MGACVMACGKSAVSQQEQPCDELQAKIGQELDKEVGQKREEAQPVNDEHILLQLPSKSLTRSWKTETKSRFFKEKMLNSLKARHKTDTDQLESIDGNADNIPSHSTYNVHTFNATGQEEYEDKHTISSETRSCFEREEGKDMEEEHCINLRGKKCLTVPFKGRSYADQRFIFSTEKIKVTTLIKQKIFYSDQSYYEGQWRKGMRHGQGKLTWRDGSKFQGEWKEDNIEGLGILVYRDGESFSGNFIHNVAEGEGQYHFSDGSKYIGDWSCNFQHGKGVEIFANGEEYKGSWSKGKKCGYGELYFQDGTYYKGQFVNNELHGHGEYNYGEKVYSGQWLHNEKSGQGCMTWTDGNRYEGEFLHDKMNGKGKWFDKSGSIFEGSWRNGKKQGKFTEYLPSGKIVRAEWCFNKVLRYLDKSKKQQ